MATTRRLHVFLSLNSADKPAVERLAGRLGTEDIDSWLEVWYLIPVHLW